MGSKITERFRHGDPVRVVSRGGTVWHGVVDDYGELGERVQLRVNIPDCGTCRYYYDPDTNLFEDCDDADLKLAVHHEFEPGDRALVRAEGSLHSVSTLVLEYRGSSGQLRVEMEDREGPRELEYVFDPEEGWWHDDDMFAVSILPDRTAKETEPTPKDHTELPNEEEPS
jgi:hypothetical protein